MSNALASLALFLASVHPPVPVSSQVLYLETFAAYQQTHISVANPAPVPDVWPLHERIAWAANSLLAIVGYIGVIIAVSTLKKIERQTQATEAAAQAATDSANASLLYAKALASAERPWILITIERSPKLNNSFHIMATNRGRAPAQLLSAPAHITIVTDETYLPTDPVYEKAEATALPSPSILLPGESALIQPISRDDLRWICKTEDSLRRIELWEEKVFVYGKILYTNLVTPHDKQTHETRWCCWYVHGENSSDLVLTGPSAYNKHT